jgi:predicted benzoate:H+ symporter BenE
MSALELRTNYHQRVLRFMGFVILVVGFGSAVCIYWNASDADDATDSLTKHDVYQLEKLGGKELVLSSQLQEWFSSLWHGRRLALTVGCATTAASALSFFAARKPPDARADRRDARV